MSYIKGLGHYTQKCKNSSFQPSIGKGGPGHEGQGQGHEGRRVKVKVVGEFFIPHRLARVWT